MRFKIDENLPAEFAEILRKAGFDAATVMEQGLNGEPDPRIIEICQKEERVLATLDTDFSNIKSYPPGRHFGLVVFRVHKQDKNLLVGLLKKVIPLLADKTLKGRLWIVEETRIRVRGNGTEG